MALHTSSGFCGLFGPGWITLAVQALACLSCLLFETGWGLALEPPHPIARTAVGGQSLELQAVLKLPAGSGALVNNENLFLLARDEVLAPLTAKAGITPWKSTQRIARSQSYVLGLLLRNPDGSLPLASVKASTIYNAMTDTGQEVRYWPFAQASPMQEVCGYDWNFQLAPLIVELPTTAERLTRLEGALVLFPSSVQRLVFSQKQVEEQALLSTQQLIVTLLRSESVKEGIGFEFLVMRPANPPDSSGNRASRNSIRQSPSTDLNPIPLAMQGSGTGFEASLLVSAGDLRKQAAYSVTTLSMEQRRRLIAEVRKTLSGGPDSPEERLNQLALSKDTVVEILSIFFDKVTGFEQINLSYTRPLGTPTLERFVLENIPLQESANEALVNQFVASLESTAPQKPQVIERPEVADSRFELRTWQDTTGKFSVEAKLIDVQDDSIRLEKADGKQITVPLVKLSQVDQEFVKVAPIKPRSPPGSSAPTTDGSANSPPALKPAAGSGKRRELSDVTIELPERFEQQPIPSDPPPFEVQLSIWKSMFDEHSPEVILIMMSSGDAGLMAEAQQDMHRTLINFSAGLGRTMGIEILRRTTSEESVVNGITLSQHRWTGKVTGAPIGGKLLGAIHDNRVYAFFFTVTAGNLDERLAEIDEIMGTLKAKQQP